MELFSFKQFQLFLFLALFLIGCIGYAVYQAPQLENNLIHLNHTYKVIGQLESLVVNITESESIGLEYLLTNNKVFLFNYYKKIGSVNKNLTEVLKLLAHDLIAPGKIQKLKNLTLQDLGMQESGIMLKQNNILPYNTQMVKFKLGRVYLEQIKKIIEDIAEEEQIILANRSKASNRTLFNTILAALFCILVMFVIIFVYIFFIRKYFIAQKKLKADLIALNENKNKFFSIISHDLRGPVNNIVRLAELSKEALQEDEKNKLSGMIEVSIKKINDLLNNLLKWASIQMNAVVILPEKLHLNKIVEENILILSELAKVKNISLINDIPLDATLWADKEMLNTIMRNLVSNAIKFTGDGGQIIVKARSFGKFIQVAIIDNGIGMSEEILGNLLKTEVPCATSGTANESGSGLGLIICREFIERNGGYITVESKLKQGSTFKFHLFSEAPVYKKNGEANRHTLHN